MPFFKKRQGIVEAERFVMGLPLPFFDRKEKIVYKNNNKRYFYVIEPSGCPVRLNDGDWVLLSHVPGRAYSSPHNHFMEIYELV